MPITNTPMNRRIIPAEAVESIWHAADQWAIRRIDWQGANPPRGSLLFLPGRGDHYEKYLETLAYYADAGWRVTAIDWRGQGESGRLHADDERYRCHGYDRHGTCGTCPRRWLHHSARGGGTERDLAVDQPEIAL